MTTPSLFAAVRAMKRRRMTPADVVIFAGIVVNVVVIGLIVYYFVL